MCSSRPTIVLHVYLTCCLLLGISKLFTRLSHTSRQKSWSAFYLPDISFVFFLSSCLNVIFSLSATDLLHPARRLVEWLRHRLGAFCESEHKMIRHLSSSQFHLLMFVFFFYTTASVVAYSAHQQACYADSALNLRINFQHVKVLLSGIWHSLVAPCLATFVVTLFARKKCKL